MRGKSMNLIEINKDTCNQDGICAEVCPIQIISFSKGQFPEPVSDADELCIRCGHCVAVCPTASLTHKDMPVENCPPVNPDMMLTAEQCEHFFRMRRSIRTYKDKTVDPDTISRLIDIAHYAPTGHNSQCVEWMVIDNRQELTRLGGVVIDWMGWMIENMPEVAASIHMDRAVARWEKGSDVIFRGAPALILAHADKYLRPAPAACTIALTYLELAAPTLGLGGCWAGYFMAAAATFPPMQQALGLAENHQCFGAMMIGYPRFSYKRLPLRNKPEITWRSK
jgi:nitroreductase/NAD-dependent dihydropyrimidine dehydrogenase PreA subunit